MFHSIIYSVHHSDLVAYKSGARFYSSTIFRLVDDVKSNSHYQTTADDITKRYREETFYCKKCSHCELVTYLLCGISIELACPCPRTCCLMQPSDLQVYSTYLQRSAQNLTRRIPLSGRSMQTAFQLYP